MKNVSGIDLSYLGHDQVGATRAADLIIPCDDYYLLDASAGDATSPASTVHGGSEIQNNWQNCRYIRCDAAGQSTLGIVKIDYTNKLDQVITEVLTLVPGVPLRIRNVIKLYQYYVGSSAGTAQSYSAAGSLITNAIKLMR